MSRTEFARHECSRIRHPPVPALIVLAACLCILAVPAGAAPEPALEYRVFVLNSYHPTFIWTDGQSDGIIDSIKETGLNVSITVEYLDWKKYPDQKNLDKIAQVYREKYRDRPFDVILTTDDAALNFILVHRPDIFGDTPVVFCGLNNYHLLNETERRNMTGNIEEISPEKTLASVFMLFPSTKTIYILYEDTETGQGIADRIRREEPNYRDRAEFIYITNITFGEMTPISRTFHEDSVVISSFTRDRNGVVMDHDRVMQLLTRESAVPVFSLYEMAMGHGAIGGSILSGHHEGVIAGEMAVRVLKGEPVSSISVNDGPTSLYVFDQIQLDRFKVPAGNLPEGSMVINREPGILDRYFSEVVSAVLIIFFLVGGIIILAANIRKRKAVEAELRQNIDARVQAGLDLQRSEDRYRQLFESSPVSLWEEDFSEGRAVFDQLRSEGVTDFRNYFLEHPDEVGRLAALVKILDVNQATLTLLGATNKDELYAGLPQLFTPESLETFREEIIALAEGRLQYSSEITHLTMKGETISVIVSMSVAPGYEQSLGRVLISLLDITNLKRAEEELRCQVCFLQELMDTIPSPVFFKDTGGRYLGCNRAFEDLSGHGRQEIIGRTAPDIWPEEYARAFTESDRKLLASPGIQEYESGLIDAHGIMKDVIFSKATFHDPDGSLRGIIGVITDITERKRTESGLQQATKKLNLLTQITHNDLQNAVFSLAGYLELQERQPSGEIIRTYTEKETAIVKKITDLLNYAKNFQNLGLHPPVWQHVEHVFIFAISHLDMSAIKRKSSLGALEVYADPLLENVFFTLVENSLLHGEHVSTITLSYEQSADGLSLFYEDDGIGIPGEMKEEIFSRRLESSRGMGLHLAREILSITGISIREDGRHGKGIRFEIGIPRGGYRFGRE